MEKHLKSPIIVGLALIIGILSGLVKIFGAAFPNQAQLVATVCLVLVTVYLIYYLVKLGRNLVRGARNRLLWSSEDIAAHEWLARQYGRNYGSIDGESEISDESALGLLVQRYGPDYELIDGESEISDEAALEWLARRYGLNYEQINIESEISDEGVMIHRHLIVKAHSMVPQLDNTLILLPDEDSRIQPQPARVRPINSDRTLTIDPADAITGRILVGIGPALREGENLEFVIDEAVRGKFYEKSITSYEYQRRNREKDHDYFAWRIDRPTRDLTLTVTFLENIKPITYSHRVFYAPVFQSVTLLEQQEETRRVTRPVLKVSGTGQPQLQLKVDYPAVGLVYAINWSPPIDDSQS